jgi:hypothetical protein
MGKYSFRLGAAKSNPQSCTVLLRGWAVLYPRRASAIYNDNDELSINSSAITRNSFGSFDVIFKFPSFSDPHSRDDA